MESDHKYSVKNVKTFTGMEGPGFNASLYDGKKRVAFIIDDATGGAMQFQWLDKMAKTDFYNFIEKEHSNDSKSDGMPNMNDEIFVSKLVEDFLSLKEKKRWCKNQTVFRLKEDPEGEYRVIPKPFSTAILDSLESAYAGQIEEIANITIGQTPSQ